MFDKKKQGAPLGNMMVMKEVAIRKAVEPRCEGELQLCMTS